MEGMILVEIDSIRTSLVSQQRVVILKEVDAERYLPIWVGLYEAEHLTVALQQVEIPRPMTYELIVNLLNSLDSNIIRVEVNALKNDTFFANIVVGVNGKELIVDSRPSDALNLAIRGEVPIYVSEHVIQAAGIAPEEGIDEEEVEGKEENLSAYEDFINKLDFSGDEEDAEDNSEK